MGIFEFFKSAGRSLGILEAENTASAQQSQEDAKRQAYETVALSIESHVAAVGVPVVDFDAIYKGNGWVRLFGTTDTNADREKILTIVGNVEGIDKVEDNLKVENPEPESTFHTVAKGDTLSKIAGAVYGNIMLYPVIFEANRPMINDPDEIFPGQVLRCPPLEVVTHTVKQGETLGGIAKTYYGNVRQYEAIFAANTDVLDNPNVIEPGQVLKIPGLG